MGELRSQILKNSFWNFLATLINRGGSLIFTILLARILLPEGFGIYSIVMSVAVILITLANLGVNSTLTRYVSYAIKNKYKAANYFRYLFKIKSILTFLVAFILIFLSKTIALHIFHQPLLYYPFLIASIYIIFLSFESFFTSLLYAFKNVKTISAKEFLSNTLKILILIVLFYTISSELYIIGAISSMSIAFLFSISLMVYVVSKKYKFIFKKSKTKIDKKRILNFLFYMGLVSISVTLFSYIDVLIMGLFVIDFSFIGFYRAAFSLVFSIGGLLIFSNVLYPVFTQLKKKELQSAFNKSVKYISIFIIPTIFGLIVLSKYIIRLMYGYDYLLAAIPFAILSFLIVEMTIGNLFLMLLSAREKPKSFTKHLLFILILNIILDYIVIMLFKDISLTLVISGVACATVISRLSYSVILYFIIKKELKVKIYLTNFTKPLIASLVFSVILIYLNSTIIGDLNLIIGFMEIIGGAIIYALCLIILRGISLSEIRDIFKLRLGSLKPNSKNNNL